MSTVLDHIQTAIKGLGTPAPGNASTATPPPPTGTQPTTPPTEAFPVIPVAIAILGALFIVGFIFWEVKKKKK